MSNDEWEIDLASANNKIKALKSELLDLKKEIREQEKVIDNLKDIILRAMKD